MEDCFLSCEVMAKNGSDGYLLFDMSAECSPAFTVMQVRGNDKCIGNSDYFSCVAVRLSKMTARLAPTPSLCGQDKPPTEFFASIHSPLYFRKAISLGPINCYYISLFAKKKSI